MAASDSGKKRATDDDSSLPASERQKSSPASSSGGYSRWTYEVFLSFRGEDTRNNFTDHLYAALKRTGIYTFRDDERLERGKEISSKLLEAIERSLVSIIILSKNYVSSTWCLDELVKIVECMEAKDLTVLPVFYKVDPLDVRKQRGDFKTAFDKHEQDFRDNLQKVERWRSALTLVGKISGWHLHDGSEAELINKIVDKIWKRLNQIQNIPSVYGKFVGIDSRVEEIYKLLKPDVSSETRFVGIWGMGGIGKTTIARVVYERLSYKYEGHCFLPNVREASKNKGLESLQEMLLHKVLGVTDLNICHYDEGISLIRRRLCRMKIFLVLDDVDQLKQLEGLAGKDWFVSGSRIIITTRDEHVLKSYGIDDRCKVRGLNYNEAHRLFYLKAFKRIRPTTDHIELLRRVVHYADGLPLALEILGSFLCGRNVNEWKSALERLEVVPDQTIMKILGISFDGLEMMEQKIFLDIACFFKGKDVDKVKEILDSCNFYTGIGISVLVERSLITIEGNKLQMHDLVQGMGWQVVRKQDPNEPGKWSRLWLCEDVYRVLARNMGTPSVEAMIPIKRKMDITHVNGKCFSTLSNLRLLINISNVHISEDLEYLSNELRFLKWWGYPLKTLPSSFHPQNLFQLSLCCSRIEYLWDGVKSFGELKIIKLSYSRNLVRTPDFTNIPNLERLDFQYCTGLLEVHPSIASLRRLVVLKLNECKNLVHFPSDVYGLKSLEILNLHGCSKLDRLPLNLEEMEHLEELDVGGTAIRQVPSSIAQLTNLRTLSFRGSKLEPPETRFSFLFSRLLPTRNCMDLLLPSLAGLSSLQALDLSDCNLSAISEDFGSGSFNSLKELNLGGNNFARLPDTICQLSKLQILCLQKCHKLRSLPELPPGIVFVGAEDCRSLETTSNVLELTSPEIALHFFNCFNLVETRGKSNYSLAITLLKCWLQINYISNHDRILVKQFHIRLPGSEIPELFNCKSDGNALRGILPYDWLDDEFIGFAVCAVFSLPDHGDQAKIMCSIGTSYVDIHLSFSIPEFTTIKSDHLWLGFLSRDRVPYTSPFRVVGAVFLLSVDGGAYNYLVKRCGIRPLYKQDVEHLEDLSATDVGISIVHGLISKVPRVLEPCRISKYDYYGFL